ncbi:MAG: hypothetical protein H7Y37_14230 [Anaerolineae bacterium]|nr:hypothetical protein [Gloeobacterales cyanobacterium ES-bin-313]
MRKMLSVSLLAILTLAVTQNVLVAPATAQMSAPSTMTKPEVKATKKKAKLSVKGNTKKMKMEAKSGMMSTP